MRLLFIVFGAIFLAALIAALRELRSEGVPRGSAPLDVGADGGAAPFDLLHGGGHCDHGGHDGGGGFDGGGGHH